MSTCNRAGGARAAWRGTKNIWGEMSRLTFRQKLWLPLVLSWLCLLLITLRSAWGTRGLRLQERQRDLQNVSETAFSVIKEYDQMTQEGKLSAGEARAQALARLRSMRYGTDGYFSVNHSNTVMVMHPIKPEMVGKNMSSLKDPAGNLLFDDIARIAKSGGGFVDYRWPKPGSDAPQPKKSYVMYFEPWAWCLVTGTYMDDIDTAFHTSLKKSLGLLFGVVLCMPAPVPAPRVTGALRRA